MPRKKRSYEVVGTAPVEVDGKTYYPADADRSADEFDAVPAEVAFLVQVGALKEKKG